MKRTPLYDFHIECGARIVDFAGWEMPLLYTGIIEEHRHTREVGSFFDVSHMGRIEFRGADATALLQRICTRQLGDAKPGQSRYGHICREDGGILDDVIVSRYENHWLMVCNASNRDRIMTWIRQHANGRNVEIQDLTESTLMVAIQGPAVLAVLADKLPIPITDLKRYRFATGEVMGVPYTVFRSGYTGEDGIEVILPAMMGPMLTSLINDTFRQGDINFKPAGLGARDTLRLEAGMPLYGHELSVKVDSISAGLAWCVDLNKDFIGVDRLREVARKGPDQKLVGLEIAGRRIARQGSAVCRNSQSVGEVTSGTFSPTLQKCIAMAYVRSDLAQPNTALAVDLSGKVTECLVVPLPFYRRGH